jgi:PTH1 family peptidyl-tRNA hydrolase
MVMHYVLGDFHKVEHQWLDPMLDASPTPCPSRRPATTSATRPRSCAWPRPKADPRTTLRGKD